MAVARMVKHVGSKYCRAIGSGFTYAAPKVPDGHGDSSERRFGAEHVTLSLF
jgi:hypothetical protein